MDGSLLQVLFSRLKVESDYCRFFRHFISLVKTWIDKTFSRLVMHARCFPAKTLGRANHFCLPLFSRKLLTFSFLIFPVRASRREMSEKPVFIYSRVLMRALLKEKMTLK